MRCPHLEERVKKKIAYNTDYHNTIVHTKAALPISESLSLRPGRQTSCLLPVHIPTDHAFLFFLAWAFLNALTFKAALRAKPTRKSCVLLRLVKNHRKITTIAIIYDSETTYLHLRSVCFIWRSSRMKAGRTHYQTGFQSHFDSIQSKRSKHIIENGFFVRARSVIPGSIKPKVRQRLSKVRCEKEGINPDSRRPFDQLILNGSVHVFFDDSKFFKRYQDRVLVIG